MRRLNIALIVGLVSMSAFGGNVRPNPIVLRESPLVDYPANHFERKSSKRRRSRYEARGW